MAKGVKTGGRRKGTLNKSTQEVQAWIDEIFQEINPTEHAKKLIQSESDKVSAMVFLRLMEYRYGKPTEHLQADINVNFADLLCKMRDRVNASN